MKMDYDVMMEKAERLMVSEPDTARIYANMAIADRLDRLCRILSSKRD